MQIADIKSSTYQDPKDCSNKPSHFSHPGFFCQGSNEVVLYCKSRQSIFRVKSGPGQAGKYHLRTPKICPTALGHLSTSSGELISYELLIYSSAIRLEKVLG